ncbi:MAG: NAD(P)/FAD-dependent oxidoreductase [Xenococcaceae cyanobacterium]
MAVEYDLIVIGGSPEGISAAVTASYLSARVALVEQPFKEHLGGSEAIMSRTLTHTARLSEQLSNASQFGIYPRTTDLEGMGEKAEKMPKISPPLIRLTEVKSWAEEVISTLAEQDSPAILASLGVDVIRGAGEFCRLPNQAFIVKNRRLRSRAYLIATGSHSVIPEFEGLQEIGYLTPLDIWQKDDLESLPNNLVIVGGSPIGIELAQSLGRLGRNVTLVVEDNRILPREEPEASMLIQSQLEAEGVRIFTQSPITQVRRIEDKKWVQAGNTAIESDEIVLATPRKPNVEGLNLEGVGVQFGRRGIQLNEKLQTTNPRIYVCGDVAGGYQFVHIAQYEAGIALKNALFLPLFKVDYRTIPWAIFTEPQLARVGMTEAQARRRYGKDVFVARQYFKSIAQAQVLGETTGFCKLVVRGNGKILGAHIVGPEAGELIGAIALAMKNKIKLGAIANFPHPTLSEITHKTAIEWQRQRLIHNKTLRNFLESLFNWRRNW